MVREEFAIEDRAGDQGYTLGDELAPAGREVVDDDRVEPRVGQRLHNVRPDVPGTAGYEPAHESLAILPGPSEGLIDAVRGDRVRSDPGVPSTQRSDPV